MLEELRERYFVRTGLLAGVSTIVMTASFIGILAFMEGQLDGLSTRVPWYLVFAALVFTATVVFLERNDVIGRVIIGTAIALALASFGLGMLTTEGLIYTVRNPEEVFVSQLVLYFLAAGLVGTGFGYWAIKHWREFTSPVDPNGEQL
jgi:hypothetical protein